MSTNCTICGRELTNDVSVIRGIGPICRTKVFEKIQGQTSRVCDYEVEFFNRDKIVVIHEKADPKNPKISLTNCIEYVIREIVAGYNLCPGIWSFVEHSSWKEGLFGGYCEYDLVSIDGESIEWRYLYHSDAKGEIKQFEFSNDVIIDRVKAYRRGEKTVIGLQLSLAEEGEPT